MKTLCIYGCGGMGRELADLAPRIDQWENIIFIDDNKDSPLVVDDIPVFTLEDAQVEYNKSELEFIISAGEPAVRERLSYKLKEADMVEARIIDNNFILSKFSSIGKGTIVHTGATVTVNVHIGKSCLLNKHCVIGHDVNVGDYTVISPNVTIGGNVNIGSNCYIGSGAIIRNGISIGDNSIIGMGAVILKDVEQSSVMVGNPAKLLRKNTDKKVFK